MSAEIYDRVIGMCEKWKHDAHLFALMNPMGFFVVMGCMLPEYIKQINKLEDCYTRLRERERDAA